MRIERALCLIMGFGLALSCRKSQEGAVVAQPEVMKNLEAFIEPVKAGLVDASNPGFRLFGPVPTAQPWERPVATGSLMVMDRTLVLRTGRDGLLQERYEARPCADKPLTECVELLATGRFGGKGEIMCFGLQLQKQGDEVVRQALPLRASEQCPYATAPGPAPQANPTTVP
jgi:hypothetical protein